MNSCRLKVFSLAFLRELFPFLYKRSRGGLVNNEKPYGPELRAGNRRNVPTAGQRWVAPETVVERRQWVAPGARETSHGKSSGPHVSAKALCVATSRDCMGKYDGAVTVYDQKRKRSDVVEGNTEANDGLMEDTGCKDVVVNSWISSSGEVLPTHLEKCSLDLKKWGGDFVRRIGREIDLFQSQLNNLRGRRDVTTLATDWNMELLNTLLLPRDVSLILKLPVSVHFDDKWCWRGDLRGLYSVKNGYRALSSMVDSTVNVSWKSIWRLKIPPAVHNFLWRCMHKILPVMTVLAARRVDVDTLCPLCRAHPETMDHLLHNCVCVGPLWQIILNGPIPDIGVDCVTWMFDTLSHGDGAQNLRVAAVWWSVWRARNDVVWNGKPWHLMNVVHEVYRNIEAWQNLGSASLVVDTYSHAWQSGAANSEDEAYIKILTIYRSEHISRDA
nr:uncharacterized protein LOC109177267 [Ipomoea batatas]